MPELPELVNFKQYIDSTSLHQKIAQVEVLEPDILSNTDSEKLRSALEGLEFKAAAVHGKYLFLQTTDSYQLVLHFGMTGRPVYYKKEEQQPDYPRLLITFTNGYHLAFDCMRMLGKVSLISDQNKFIEEKNLGPDALKEVSSVEKFLELFSSKRGMIKTALMDQSLLAGIGNVCSDEILFQSRIHPKTPVNDLKKEQLKKIYDNMHSVLKTKIEAGLSPDGLPNSYILKHRSEGAQCPSCGSKIKKIKVGGRSAYYCPNCQKK